MSDESEKVLDENTFPPWYRQPAEQVDTLRELLENAKVYKELKKEFEAATANIPAVKLTSPSEILLLAFYLGDDDSKTGLERTIRILWDAVDEPKWYWRDHCKPGNEIKNNFRSEVLRLEPGYVWESGVCWVLYDYKSYYNLTAGQALEEANKCEIKLATIEPLLIVATNRNYAEVWRSQDAVPPPYMPGLQFDFPIEFIKDCTRTSLKEFIHTPFLFCGKNGKTIVLDANHMDGVTLFSPSSPTIQNVI